jgi:hypothetical protein
VTCQCWRTGLFGHSRLAVSIDEGHAEQTKDAHAGI